MESLLLIHQSKYVILVSHLGELLSMMVHVTGRTVRQLHRCNMCLAGSWEAFGIVLHEQVKWAVRADRASSLVVLFSIPALCITGRSEVDKSSWAAVSRDQGEAAFEAKTTFFTTPKLGGSPERSLITDCRQSFIYKPQGFYWKSEELISCLPILGHHHKHGSSREEKVCFILFSC